MQVIASYALKGGVGKTTCAVNLAFIAAQQSFPTLLWDLEPQGVSSYYFRIKPKIKGGGKALLGGKHRLNSLIKATDFPGLDLLPADFSIRNMDLLLEGFNKPSQRLRKLLQPLANEYAYVILDCPPSGSLLAEAVLAAADAVLVPLAPTPLSLENLARLKKLCRTRAFDPQRLLPFVSMLDRRKALHREVGKQLAEAYPEMLNTAIPYAPIVERMAVERLPLGAFATRTAVAKAFEKLWEEIRQRLDVPIE
ncbi:MAG: ParA family protein [Gammaproteobacteria bacterium]